MVRSSNSFTLIELIIAIFILAVGIVGVLQAFPIGTQVASMSKMATVATQLAQQKMEEIISKPYTDISSEATTTLSSPFQAYSRAVEVTCYDPNGEGISPDCPDTGIKKIEVIVLWKSPLGPSQKEVKIASLISRR